MEFLSITKLNFKNVFHGATTTSETTTLPLLLLRTSIFSPAPPASPVAQAKWFTTNYEIVTHYPNDASGFSATLFKCIKNDPISGAKAGEFTLSFRRTEYQLQAKGGDYEADGSDATDGDIGAVKGVSVSLFSELR